MKVNAADLVGYCGHFCAQCGICGLNIELHLDALRRVIEAGEFSQQAEGLAWPPMREIAVHCCQQFEDQVDAFGALAAKLFPSHCRGGCVPPCRIVRCCRERGYTTCVDCAELEMCEALAPHRERLIGNWSGIRTLGLEVWAHRQLERIVEQKRKALIRAVAQAFDDALAPDEQG